MLIYQRVYEHGTFFHFPDFPIFQIFPFNHSIFPFSFIDDLQFIDDFPQRTLHHQKDLMGMAEGNQISWGISWGQKDGYIMYIYII